MRLSLIYKLSPNLHKFLSFYYHLYFPRILFQLFNEPHGVLVYVGVNTGESLVKIFYKYKEVYAFEANPVLANLLTKRFSISSKTSIEIINCAVGKRDGSIELNLYEERNNFANSSVAKLNKNIEIKKILIKEINLANFLEKKNINYIDHYISDVEGYDFLVLSTLLNYINEKRIGKIQCEVVVDGIESPYLDIKNYESLFDELLSPKYIKVGSGWGTLEVGEFKNIAGYRFRDVMWQPREE